MKLGARAGVLGASGPGADAAGASLNAELVMIAGRLGPLLAAAVAGCAWQGPSLAGHAGLQQRVMGFYNARAIEEDAMCPQPRMTSVVRTRTVEEAPGRVAMDPRYHYRDDAMTVESAGGTKYGCDGFAERTFTFARNAEDGLEVVGMTGAQRRP